MNGLEIKFESTERRNKRTIFFDGVLNSVVSSLIPNNDAERFPFGVKNTEFLGIGKDGLVRIRAENSSGSLYAIPEEVYCNLVDGAYR